MGSEAAGGRCETPRWIPPRGWTGEGEVFAAGFLHRDRYDDVPAGSGFAAGGFMDELQAGPLLAALVSEITDATGAASTTGPAGPAGAISAAGATSAAGPAGAVNAARAAGAVNAASAANPADATGSAGDYAALGESELIGVLSAWRRLASWARPAKLLRSPSCPAVGTPRPAGTANAHLSEHIADEIAAALTLTGQAAAGLHGDALALARLPQVHASLTEPAVLTGRRPACSPASCVTYAEMPRRAWRPGAAGGAVADYGPDPQPAAPAGAGLRSGGG